MRGAGRCLMLTRRKVLSAAGVLLAASMVPAFAREPQKGPVSPDDALKRLLAGNERYAANAPQQRDYSAARLAGAEVTAPVAAILSCSDSRVPAEIIFDQAPGGLFVIRVAGNVLNEDSLASLEYAVKYLSVPLVMVLGHTDCGALVFAAQLVRQRTELPGRVAGLVKSLQSAVITAHGRHPRDLVGAAIEENVKLNVKGLAKEQPILSEALGSDKVRAVGALFDPMTGKVKLL